MSKGDASLLRELKKLTKGLAYMSESDYPVEPFAQKVSGQPPPSAQDIVAAKKSDPKAPVKEIDFEQFFNSATQEQDWQSAEAREQAKKFQALVKTLKDNLSEIKVYRIGDTQADVYVIGKTAAGNFAGIKTTIVET